MEGASGEKMKCSVLPKPPSLREVDATNGSRRKEFCKQERDKSIILK